MSLKVYFDATLIDEKYYTGLTNNNELFNENFKLGSTPCNKYILRIAKEGVSTQPTTVELKENNTTFAVLDVDNIEEQDYEYVYTLTDKIINLEFNYDASEIFVNDSATLLQIVQDICTKAGLTLGTNNFRGYNKSISWYDNTRTARQYIGYVAELNGGFARIVGSTLYFIKQNTNSVKTIDIDNCEDFRIGDYHKITRVVYELGAVHYEYGDDTENTLYLSSDNVFITEQSEVQAIYNEIKDFEFYSFTSENCPIDYNIKAGDIITFTDGVNNYKTIAQYDLEYYGGWIGGYSLDVNSKKQEETQVISTDKKVKNLKIIVDRDSNRIKQIAEATPEITTTKTGYGSVNFTNINEGQPIYMRIYPVNENIMALYISDDLTISDNLYITDVVVRFTNTTTNEIFDYILPDDLLYYDQDNYDEFILDYDKKICQIIKRCELNENNVVESWTALGYPPVIVDYPYPTISMTAGDYTISVIRSNNAYIQVKLMIQNGYTKQFATKLEMSTEFSQTEKNIEMRAKKNEIISTINQSAEAVTINANKISLDGKQINLTGDNITIKSDNFNVDTQGNMTCNNASITGGEIELTSLENTPKMRIKSNTTGTYGELFATGFKFYESNQLKIFLSALVGALLLSDNSFGETGIYPGAIRIKDIYQNDLVTINTNGDGNITCVSLTQTSREENKKNFEKLENALDIVMNTEIYKYNLKNQKDGDKKHIGFIIGDKYKYSEEITSEKNDGVDPYSMISVLWKAVQEQQEEIKRLKEAK